MNKMADFVTNKSLAQKLALLPILIYNFRLIILNNVMKFC